MSMDDENTLDIVPRAAPSGSAADLSLQEIEELWGETIHEMEAATQEMTLGQADLDTLPEAGTVFECTIAREGAAGIDSAEYAILEKIGQGGMGAIYAARQVGMDRRIALKTIIPGKDGAEAQAKFVSEALVTGELDHPNIVPVHEIGRTPDGTYFYSMKEVKGRSWKDVLPEKSEQENLQILLSVCDAMAFAHDKGYVHRDLKPENVMLGGYGEVLVMDWGLAVTTRPDGKAEPVTERMSQAGTPAYMAPEMATCEGARIGAWSDIYLLGGILFEIATGERPHGGDNLYICLYSAMQNHLPDVDRDDELIHIAMRAMATAPGDRYQSVKSFAAALQGYLSHQEAVSLMERARRDLKEAKASPGYDKFNQALFGFREAAGLWPENAKAETEMEQAQFQYGQCALERQDFDLALSILDPADENQATVFQEAKKQRDARDRRRRRLRVSLISSALLLVGLAVSATLGFLRVEAARERTEEALQQLQQKQAETLAAKEAESQERRKAEFRLYRSQIAQAQGAMERRHHEKALLLLEKTDSRYRHWEFGYLKARARQMSPQPVCFINGRAYAARESDWFKAMALEPDGKYLAALSAGRLYLYGLQHAEPGALLPLKRRFSQLAATAFSSDGSRLAIATSHGKVQFLETQTWGIAATLHTGITNIQALVFSENDKRLVVFQRGKAGGPSNPPTVWSLKDQSRIPLPEPFRGPRDRWGHSITGKRSLLWFRDKKRLTLFSPASFEVVFSIPLPGSGNWPLWISRNENYICTGPPPSIPPHQSSASVYDRAGNKVMTGRQLPGACAGFTADGHLLLKSLEGPFTAWNWRKNEPAWVLSAPSPGFSLYGHQIVQSGNGRCLAAVSRRDAAIKVWRRESPEGGRYRLSHPSPVQGFVISRDSRWLATATRNQTIHLWDPNARKQLTSIKGSGKLCFTRKGELLYFHEGKAHLWDPDTRTHLRSFPVPGKPVKEALLSPSERYLGLWLESSLGVWDMKTGARMWELDLRRPSTLKPLCFSPDEKTVAFAFSGTGIRMYDVQTGTPKTNSWPPLVKSSMDSGRFITGVGFSPEGELFAHGYDVQGSLANSRHGIWQVRSATAIRDRSVLRWMFPAPALTTDSARWARKAGLISTAVLVSDLDYDETLVRVEGHKLQLQQVGFSPDGRHLVTLDNRDVYVLSAE